MIFETTQIEDALIEFEIIQIPGFKLLIFQEFVLWSSFPLEPFIGQQKSEISIVRENLHHEMYGAMELTFGLKIII